MTAKKKKPQHDFSPKEVRKLTTNDLKNKSEAQMREMLTAVATDNEKPATQKAKEHLKATGQAIKSLNTRKVAKGVGLVAGFPTKFVRDIAGGLKDGVEQVSGPFSAPKK